MATTLTRWQPFAELSELRGHFDRLLSDIGDGGRGWIPAIDVSRDEDTLRIRADVPGIKPDEIHVDVSGDVLTISGEHEERHEEKGEQFVRRERRYGAFSRAIALPTGTDPQKIQARSHDGVLEIAVPLPTASAPTSVTITPEAA
jgi:HSP20 family protein